MSNIFRRACAFLVYGDCLINTFAKETSCLIPSSSVIQLLLWILVQTYDNLREMLDLLPTVQCYVDPCECPPHFNYSESFCTLPQDRTTGMEKRGWTTLSDGQKLNTVGAVYLLDLRMPYSENLGVVYLKSPKVSGELCVQCCYSVHRIKNGSSFV